MRKWIPLTSLLVLGTAALGAQASRVTPAANPHISMAEARAIALKASPGKITKEELEKEKGGSGLRYSFDIAANGVTHEVGVDAMDGKVLENSIDNDKD
ncbi:MAG TPA: PepSY domain-containing protein [Frateuria sp.]|uniref:PepSY domain-containing protein n=1 Tax=Frateuria sp. TaxID=2211372 RepID=UPI002DE823F0|nr:PepSY domain-containing protein [Frateuria sp.]HEV2623292.1 PepSY domain-containing protein [Frateuria sp.]